MRKITHIVIHCTATSATTTVAAIQNYWRTQLGWTRPGYHLIIEANGQQVYLQDFSQLANGVAGHNAGSIHISYVGGINANGKPKDTRTKEQIDALTKIVRSLRLAHPKAIICGHRDFKGVAKACPSFSVSEWLTSIGIK